MKKLVLCIAILFVAVSCKKEMKSDEIVVKKVAEKIDVSDIKIETYNFEQLEPLLHLKDDKTYVINFWATWCKPCIEELPAFEKLNQKYKDKNVEVILVSLDFPKQVEKRLKPFIKKKNLQSRVIFFNDVNEDVWIKKIDENWGGAIPVTLIYNKDKRMFYQESFDYKKLENEVLTFIK